MACDHHVMIFSDYGYLLISFQYTIFEIGAMISAFYHVWYYETYPDLSKVGCKWKTSTLGPNMSSSYMVA